MTDDTMTRLRAANPVAPELTAGERREAQLLLRRVLDAAPEQPRPTRPGGRSPRRRVAALAGVATVLAAALLVAVASIDRGPGVPERAYAAITKPDFFHVVVRIRWRIPDLDHLDRPAQLEESKRETWYDTGSSPAYHNVEYRLRNGRPAGLLAEFAGDRNGSRSRIPAFGNTTEGDGDDRQPAERYDPTAEFKDAYKDGKVREDGETTLAGRRVRRLVIDDPPAPKMDDLQITGSRSTYFVDAGTLYPVRSTNTADVASREGRQRISGTMDYTTFETLPRTKANLALLKLGARPR